MTKKINLAIERQNIKGATKLLEEYYNKQHKAEFDKTISAEYYELFPVYRDMSYEEYIDSQPDNVVTMTEDEYSDGKPYTTPIDYSENEDFVTLGEYKNETIVVEEATEDSEEVIELVRPYIPMTKEELDAKVNAYLQPMRKAKAKADKKQLLDNGKVFTMEFGTFWFNEYWATMFMIKLNTTITLGRDTMLWKDTNQDKIDLSIDDSKILSEALLDTLDYVYFDMEI